MKHHPSTYSMSRRRAMMSALAASVLLCIPFAASAAVSLDQQMENGQRLMREAVELHNHLDNEGALRKIDQAIAVLPPFPTLFHDRAIFLEDLNRNQEALAAFNMAVEFGQLEPNHLYYFLADRANVRFALNDRRGAVEDAKTAKSLAPANADPGKMRRIAEVLAFDIYTLLGAIWRLEKPSGGQQGAIVEIFSIYSNGRTVIHFQKVRPDGSFTQMGADGPWVGDALTCFGETKITGDQWKMDITKPQSQAKALGGSFQLSPDGQQMVLHDESGAIKCVRVATLVDGSIKDLF